ncbi:SRPBCC family protein [Limoniibacter endophyticus]|uniref:ATPase n=1 Tax=Limoniibacter endophyticus TaxID=1565040 RepID=A0A8J3GGM5_9HYPH|nr:SRPBCC family protein [Limoniibacter endophyticus]GHC61006.1 ATPase [Limoniibacter endophyticus]
MEIRFSVSGRISRPVSEVFEAVVNPERLSRFFTTGGATGRIQPGAVVEWDFHDFPGAFPVYIDEVEEDRRIVLRWDASNGAAQPDANGAARTTVVMTFKPLGDGRTLVEISEYGWLETQEGLGASYDNCEGWTGMLCAMKMWLEHGINLRDGFYK